MDGSSSARSPIIANPTPYVRPSFYPERGRTAAGVAPSGDASAACYRYLQSPAMPHNAGCTYPHMGSIYQNAIPTPSTSPFRVPVSGMSNLRQFWPPTPPPDGFGRLGMNTSLYPMYPAITPLAPSSDNGMHGLIPRLGSSPSHYPHFFEAHKESSFLSPGLTIASPLTPTSSLASSTPLSSLPPSYDKSQPFSPMSLSLKNMDLCKQQYCHESDDVQRAEMYSDAVCHHPVTDQQGPGSANMEANSKYEKVTENSIYHPRQESHPPSVKPRSDSKLPKNNAGTEKKHCNKSEEDCSAASGNNNLKSAASQENLSEAKTCKVKKGKNPQCSEYIDIVNISDTPRSSEDVTKGQTNDTFSEKPRHKNCCLFPTSAGAVVTSTPLTTSTSVTYSHQQFTTSSQIYSSVSDLQMKREAEENRHDCQFAKSTCGKNWNNRSFVELCYCHSENGCKSCHVAHTGACKVSKIPKTEPSQSSCCAQRLSNHQECLPFMYQPAIYESNNHSSQMNGKCAHLSLPQNDIEQLSPAWNVLHNSPNHLQLDAISKSTSIPELSGSSKEFKLPYPSEFLPDIQPLNFSSKPQQQDGKKAMQNSSCGSKERTTSTSSVDAHSPSTPEKKTSTTTISSSTVVCTAANSNIPVGIAIAQQRHSMSSAWKLGKLTDPHFPAAHNGSEGFPSLPNTSACHKNDNILRDQPYLSVKSIPTLPSNHSGLLVSPAAKQWESDTVPRTVLPHTWLRHGRVVAPGMWIGQGNYASATPAAGLPIGPLDSAQVSVPPVGYQLVRDSLTGHILLIPAVNIELVDGTQLWPKLENSTSIHQQSTPQMQRSRYYEVLQEEDKLEHEESSAVHSTKPLVAESLHSKKKLLIAEENEEIQTVESPTPAGNVEISVANRAFEHSSSHCEKYSSISLHDCEHRPTITLAQAPVAVQTEHAKRSQATSPLISVPITLHQLKKQKVNESITNDKTSQNSTSDIPNDFCDDNCHQKTFAVQVNLERETNTVKTEEEIKTIQSPENKKNENCLKENGALEQTTNVDKAEPLQKKQSASALPLECHSSPNYIDHRGLNLLVDSIEELNCKNLTSKNICLNENSKSGCNVSYTDDFQKSQISAEKICKAREQEYSPFPPLNKPSTDSLEILCALAEQRFMEETKSGIKSPPTSSAEFCNSSVNADKNDSSKEKTCVNKPSTRSSNDKLKQHCFPDCTNVKAPSEIESKEAEMRRRLAELQQKYKQKQKELARLQPRKSKKKNISTQRCPGRPHSVRPYMYYRIRKEKMRSKSGSSTLLSSLSDDHNNGTKRNGSSENKKCIPFNEDEKDKFQLQDLHSASKVHKRSKESNTKLINNTLSSKHPITGELACLKRDHLASKKRTKKNLCSKRKVSKQEIQHQVEDDVVSFHKPSQRIFNNNLLLNVSTSTTSSCEKLMLSNNFTKQKEFSNSSMVFKTDANVSKVNLCSDHCEKYKDKFETQQNKCNINHNNENSAGYEGDTSDVEVPPAKKRKMGKSKKHSSSKDKGLDDATVLKHTGNFLSMKTNETFAGRKTIEPEIMDLKLLHCSVKQSGISKSKKKMKFKKSFEPSPKKIKSREHRKREKEEDISMTDELFAALKKCRLSETNVVGPSTANDGKEQLDSSYSEGENIPLSALIEKAAVEAKCCTLSLEDLCDKTRVLIMEEGLYYAGFITAIQAPDVYGITLDGERGNKPRIYSREEILTVCILEVKPTHIRELPEGRRICAFWSQQYRCLYPGTIGKGSPQTNQDKSSVFVEFDDGDSGSIPVDDIRFLPETSVDNAITSDSCVTLKQHSNNARQEVTSKITFNNNVGTLKKSNEIRLSEKGKTGEENSTEKKEETFTLQNCSEEIANVSLTAIVLSQKKKHSIKGNVSKKSKKSGNEGKHCSGKKECKKKKIDKCSENVSPKSKKHKKHKEDRKRNHHHHHRHHHHHHHHHHKKHKHEKSKAQKQNKSLLPLDSNNINDILKMSSTPPEKDSYSPSSETEKDTSVAVLSDFNKLARKKEQNKNSDDITQVLSTIKVTSDSLQDIKDNNTTEAQSEPQLWSWYGKSFRRPGSKRKARKEYYRAISRGNEILKVGDCAVFISSGRPHLPYIGQIETMWQSWGGSMVVKVKWFYHPEEMKQNIDLSSFKGALFQSTHVDENDVQTISHKCELLTKQEYKRRMDLRRNTQYNGDNKDIYYLAGSYDPVSGIVMPELEYA